MEDRSSHTYSKTWERSDESRQLSSNRTPFNSRQSSRENNTKKTIPSCGLNKLNYPRATRIPTQPFDITPTLKSGGGDKVWLQKTKLDCRTASFSLRSRTRRRYPARGLKSYN
ncbi:hypothetical protein TNCV_2705581 [Trichonephila clavipes]|nr:hypothetical protein TNCV_2705581 [Trichonephila clavipes]